MTSFQLGISAQLRRFSLEYSSADLAEATCNWSISRRLGAGNFGAVYKGELLDGSEVAIKAIDLGAMGAAGQSPEMAGFEEEVMTLSKFRHPNLVTLLGWGKQARLRYLVYELLSGGDAFQRLQKSLQPGMNQPFHWHERLGVCLDAATGLSYMHNAKPKAFHRDIKSANILLDKHGTAKMADFGLSCTTARVGDLHRTVKIIGGTPGYACPIYSRTGRVTEGSEVYSFGMVMLELLTGLSPAVADSRAPGGISFPVQSSIAPAHSGAIERCLRCLDSSAGWPPWLAERFGMLALRCVFAHDEGRRPPFVEVVRALRKMREEPVRKASPRSATPQPRPPEPLQSASPRPATPPPRPPEPVRNASPRSAKSPSARPEPPPKAEPQVLLELCGSGVADVPLLHRCIGPVRLTDGPIIVGRRHQLDLFKRVVKRDLLEFISREHFRLERAGGAFVLHALSSNPVWHGREGEQPVELRKGQDAIMVLGDCIIVDTDHVNPTSATMKDKVLYWHFTDAPSGKLTPEDAEW